MRATWDLARTIVNKRRSWIERSDPFAGDSPGYCNGSMHRNIMVAVEEGIRLGIEIGKSIQRDEIIDFLKPNGEADDEVKTQDEAAPVEGSA